MRIFVFSLLFIPFALFGRVNQDGDYQVWFYQSVEKEFREAFFTRFQTEFRFGDDVSKLYFKYGQIDLVFRPTRWFHIGPGYRHAYTRLLDPSMDWKGIYSPFLDVIFLGT